MKKRIVLIFFASILGAPQSWGYTNPIDSGGTETVSNTWLVGDDLYIGQNNSNNTMIVTNTGFVSNTIGYIGNNTNSDHNAVIVTGSGSSWTNASELYIGDYGSDNELSILDVGRVWSLNGYIGRSLGSDWNSVTLDGSGSAWVNSGVVYVGRYGVGNVLSITNGGAVFASASWIGYTEESSNNVVRVNGLGSVWSNKYQVAVGEFGDGNSLHVENGAIVESGYGYIGGIQGASNNTVVVSGTNAAWINHSELYIGNMGGSNALVMTAGGRVYDDDGYINGASRVAVLGTNSLWSNDGTVEIGHMSSNCILSVTGGGGVTSYDGYVGHYDNASNNLAVISGTGSTWTNGNDLFVGHYGSDNTLIITSGARIESGDCYMGYYSGASNNTVQVSGPDSLLTNSFWFSVGESSAGNALYITEGGMVQDEYGYIGRYAESSNNTVEVSGSGSVWSNVAWLVVGDQGSGNNLTITNGAVVQSGDGFVGFTTNAFNNVIEVVGAGSALELAYSLVIGAAGNSNFLSIANGGRVQCDYGTIGNASNAVDNAVVVSGTGSVWSIGYSLYVVGSGNRLEVEDGGEVSSPLYAYVLTNGVVRLESGGTLAALYYLTIDDSAAIQIGINSAAGADHGRLTVGYQANLAGTLEVDLMGGFTPSAGMVFDVFDWDGTVNGVFATVDLPSLSSGLTWNTNDLYVGGTLSVDSSVADSDGDGMPDWWELAHFGGPTNAVATDHGDGDTHNNISEYIAGTDPTNETSYLKITNAVAVVTGFMVEWEPVVSGRWYHVQWTNELTNSFMNLSPDIEFPQNRYTDTVHHAEAAGFYQVDVRLK